MVSALRDENEIILKFGGGVHSRASEDEIDPRECADGKNFDLDLENREFRNRKPFDLVGTVPNGTEIRGFVQLLKSDDTRSFLVQATDTVYEWDGVSFVRVGTVGVTARLRGRLEHNWKLDGKVLITDLNLVQPVMEWNGTTLQNITHNLVGLFMAKYCYVAGERAHFANVISNAVATPHLLAGSKVSDFTTLSLAGAPAGAADPFFLLTPDLGPINGLVEAFQVVVVSSRAGSIFILSGTDATNFVMSELYPRSAAEGDESVAYVGNDIVYGRQGRIESVLATDKFGDVQTDDITVPIQDRTNSFTGWTTVYNSRVQRVYFFPDDQLELWVFHKDLIDSNLSPWSVWRTQHTSNFQPTAVMNMLDPVDGLEYVFFGDALGNLYRLEGSGSGDAGSATIQTERLSALFTAPLDEDVYDVEGWIKYRKNLAATVTMRFEYAGEAAFTEVITIQIPAVTGAPVYGGDVFYGGEFFYGVPFAGRLTRQKFGVAGSSNEFQVRLTIDSLNDFQINEVGLRFAVAS